MPLPHPVHAPQSAASGDLGALPEWDLTDLYPSMDAPEVAQDLQESLERAKTFEASYKGRLAEMAQDNVPALVTSIRAYEDLEDLMGRLISFAGLVYAGNTIDPSAQKFYGDVQEQITTASSHLLFFTLELNTVDDAIVEAALEDGQLAHYRPWIEDLRKGKPYQLEDRVEQLFHEKSVTGSNAWNRLFDETMASLTFEVDGEKLAIEPTLNLLVDPSADNRGKAFAALNETFSENLRTFALITNTLAKDKEISDRWRNFKDIADSRHLANRVERDVVDALVAAVRDAYPRLSHRYYRLKANWLGVEQLNCWDRNAPLPDADTRVISWDEARQTVLSAYDAFSPEMSEIAGRFFDKGWIDAPARSGKAPGAFAHPTVPSAHPYVLVNYQGKIRDVMTLAHELGHGVHQVLAGHNGTLMAPTPLTLAETASVFGEMLTFKSLLAKADNPQTRKIMLASKAEDMINTVVRQIAFYSFERKVHTERRNGELTSDKIGELWMSVQGESLGPAIKLNEGYESFWTYIPHFIHSPFYVYAYAFGDCLVNSLFAVYEDAETGFQEKYFDLLKAGGTKHHSELLTPFGLSASDPDFWKKGLSVIERIIDELEELDGA
ncbi:MAG: M3 family oligoendopeptidase [Roseibium album]|uniref:Oligoendopeptidase F, plasmid n=1 Tax=Roseibium album TaxID=311410 RepID=A0A0M7A520_9HYPH|nr:M3 family oligoendopeptidase [Roseibium album]MBG6159499.1 oligoendopeptidase F [Labrenzia sp. EL_162]MBG6164249.1 oligoendopeptidase F [Labrenzia sp. EL_195]MBG6198103.1 oligoendopeptidase F [Labrenzia sp. EL_159]MBG6204455.1 oligoendopeptidase F [Labrenzia sp. EL_13]MBG6208714.1 oligoendopeptidase F [Labrenzia sp. EL_126]